MNTTIIFGLLGAGGVTSGGALIGAQTTVQRGDRPQSTVTRDPTPRPTSMVTREAP